MRKSTNNKTEKKISDILKNRIIGISISESEDLKLLGFGHAHLVDVKIEISRYLLSSGVTLMYGGDLRDDGFTFILFDLVESYTNINEDHCHLIHYLGWPSHYKLNSKIKASLSEKINFVLPGLPSDFKSKLSPKSYLTPDTPAKYYVWARSLTHMRKTMITQNDARVVMGGKTRGYLGKYPGIVEEVYLSMKTSKPVYLIGAFGGATKDIIDAIEGKESIRLTTQYQLNGNKLKERANFYNNNKPSGEEKIDYLKLNSFFNKKGIKGLNNGLTEDENKLLFKTTHIPEIVSLVIKGLTNKFS